MTLETERMYTFLTCVSYMQTHNALLYEWRGSVHIHTYSKKNCDTVCVVHRKPIRTNAAIPRSIESPLLICVGSNSPELSAVYSTRRITPWYIPQTCVSKPWWRIDYWNPPIEYLRRTLQLTMTKLHEKYNLKECELFTVVRLKVESTTFDYTV